MFLSIYMIMLDVFLRTLWHYDYRTLEYSTMMPFHWEYDHSGHIGLSYDLHGFSRSHRYLLQVACNCSPLVIIILSSGHFFGRYLLRDYRSHGSQTLHYETTCTRDVRCVIRLLIQTPVLDLQADPDFHVFIHISRTSCPIVMCDTSTCRSWQVLHFIQ